MSYGRQDFTVVYLSSLISLNRKNHHLINCDIGGTKLAQEGN